MDIFKINDDNYSDMKCFLGHYYSPLKILRVSQLHPFGYYYYLQPHYNTLLYSTRLLITLYRHGSHCLYFLCIRPSLLCNNTHIAMDPKMSVIMRFQCIAPTISLGSHQNIGLHTGARANVVLLTYYSNIEIFIKLIPQVALMWPNSLVVPT